MINLTDPLRDTNHGWLCVMECFELYEESVQLPDISNEYLLQPLQSMVEMNSSTRFQQEHNRSSNVGKLTVIFF